MLDNRSQLGQEMGPFWESRQQEPSDTFYWTMLSRESSCSITLKILVPRKWRGWLGWRVTCAPYDLGEESCFSQGCAQWAMQRNMFLPESELMASREKTLTSTQLQPG